MKYGKLLVDQVLKSGIITDGKDISLSPSEIKSKILEYFPTCSFEIINGVKIFVGTYKNKKYAIRCKNITYLGNPHPVFKKRIQISDDLQKFNQVAKSIGAEPLLLGIYSFDDNTIFAEFAIDTYLDKKSHNSSAHVYVSDLAAAVNEGFFQKIDYYGNRVTAFRPDIIDIFLDDVLFKDEDRSSIPYSNEILSTKSLNEYIIKNEILPHIHIFIRDEKKEWFGIDCYNEMIEAGYKNKFQSEWAGFYLEYKFEQYIKKKNIESIIRYEQDKSKYGIDLDLFFPKINSYGDLKMHSETSRGIQGNDWTTISKIIFEKKFSPHIYYIVCEHSTQKDNLFDYDVTKFWNTVRNKKEIMSYHKRMKHDITLKNVYVLDINQENFKYLTKFKQGINSNGKPREPKIMIEHKNFKYFVIDKFKV